VNATSFAAQLEGRSRHILVNRRTPAPDERKDEAFVFQVEIDLSSEAGFLPRPNLRSPASKDWDERLADLQYRDAGEYAVGHNAATQAFVEGGSCRHVRTRWIPDAEVAQSSLGAQGL